MPTADVIVLGVGGVGAAAGERLYHETGLLEVGPVGGHLVEGILHSARQHGLDIERVSAADSARRFPGFRLGAENIALFERRPGVVVLCAHGCWPPGAPARPILPTRDCPD